MRQARGSGSSARRRELVFVFPASGRVMLGVVVAAAFGVPSPRSEPACTRTLLPATVEAFIDHPPGLLESALMNDQAALGDRVRRLAFHGDAAIGAISRIIALAREEQRKSIAAGLARAARECRAANPAISRSIATAAMRVSDVTFRATYLDKMQEGDAPPPAQVGDPRRDGFAENRTLLRLAPGSKTDLPPLNDPFTPLDPVKLR
jgi:hypothetical protein